MRVSSLCLTLVALASGTTAALGQDRPQPPAPQHAPGQPDARGPALLDPSEAKQHLQRRLEELERHEATIREAIRKIEQGVPVAEAMRGLGPERRPEGRPEGRLGDARPELRRIDGDRPQGEGDRREGERRLDRPVTEEEKQRTRAFLRQYMPAVADKFEAFERANPEMAERGLRRMVPRVEEAEEARERDPAFFNLKVAELEGSVNLVEAIRGYREADASKDPAKVEPATAALRKAVTRQVETRLKLQAHEIEGLTKRVDELKADLAKKDSDKSGEIDRMVKRIQDSPRTREQLREGGSHQGPDQKGPPKKDK